jgi:hypothetical protein
LFALRAIKRSAIVNATATAFIAKGRKAFGCASTDFTIVPIAGLRAKSAWSKMQPTENGMRVEMTLSSDPRLLAGVSGAVNHVAEAAGMDESSRANLVAAIEDACHVAFDHLSEDDAPIRMSLGCTGGSVEVALTLRGSAAKGDRPDKIQRALNGRIDKINREVRGDSVRIFLTKNISTHTAKR